MHGIGIEIGDKYYDVVMDGKKWAIKRKSDGAIMSRHDDYDGACERIAEMQKSDPSARDRKYRQGGDPTTGPERYS